MKTRTFPLTEKWRPDLDQENLNVVGGSSKNTRDHLPHDPPSQQLVSDNRASPQHAVAQSSM